MKAYLITYDLNKSGQNYSGLYDAIKTASYNDTWWHYLDSTWIIKSSMTTSQVYDILKPYIDNNDHILVIEVVENYYGFLPNDAWKYLKEHIFN